MDVTCNSHSKLSYSWYFGLMVNGDTQTILPCSLVAANLLYSRAIFFLYTKAEANICHRHKHNVGIVRGDPLLSVHFYLFFVIFSSVVCWRKQCSMGLPLQVSCTRHLSSPNQTQSITSIIINSYSMERMSTHHGCEIFSFKSVNNNKKSRSYNDDGTSVISLEISCFMLNKMNVRIGAGVINMFWRTPKYVFRDWCTYLTLI